MRFTVFLNHGENSIELVQDLETEYNSRLVVKSASVFWEHENIQKDVNDRIAYDNATVVLEPGYYTFDYLKSKLTDVAGKGKSISISKVEHDSRCYVSIPSSVTTVNLKKFAPILGFPENQEITATTKSPRKVDVNSGIRYVTISSNLVNRSKNYNTFGKRSTVICTLPITSTQNLNGTVTAFSDLNQTVALNNGVHKRLHFTVGNNADVNTQLKILLEFEIKNGR